VTDWLWVIFTLVAAGAQTLRNAWQRELTQSLGTVGATHVRFLYGLPFGLLFLAIVVAVSGGGPPSVSRTALTWTLAGAVAQIAATALLLAAMRERSFVLITALSKIEPVHVALFGLVFLGDHLTVPLAVAIIVACVGVLLMSWPKGEASRALAWQPILLGLAAGALFGAAAIGFRGAIRAFEGGTFVIRASTILALSLFLQTMILTLYLALRDRTTLFALFRAWRPSLPAGFMGAGASQMWFLAFAVETAAKVRTLALVEIFFAGLVSRTLFKQSLASREGLGIALIVVGVAVLLNL
jgi:drug/metabolite transporter (DMT)-like permease